MSRPRPGRELRPGRRLVCATTGAPRLLSDQCLRAEPALDLLDNSVDVDAKAGQRGRLGCCHTALAATVRQLSVHLLEQVLIDAVTQQRAAVGISEQRLQQVLLTDLARAIPVRALVAADDHRLRRWRQSTDDHAHRLPCFLYAAWRVTLSS